MNVTCAPCQLWPLNYGSCSMQARVDHAVSCMGWSYIVHQGHNVCQVIKRNVSRHQDEVASTTATDAPLDLSGEPSKRPMPPTESEVPHSVLKDYAANAVKEFLAMYGFNDAAEGILKHLPNAPINPGKCSTDPLTEM